MRNTERTTLLVTDAALSSTTGQDAIPVYGRAVLLNLCAALRAYGIDAELESDETGTAHTLTLCHPSPCDLMERQPKGRPRKGETWPEGLDTDAKRLEWVESVTADEACAALGVSRSTLYRRISQLRNRA